MSLVKQYPFTNPANYTIDSELTIAGGSCLLGLVDLAGLTFQEVFDSLVGFTYDDSIFEEDSGSLKQIDQLIQNMISWATFTSDKNLNYRSDLGNKTTTLLGTSAWNAGGYITVPDVNSGIKLPIAALISNNEFTLEWTWKAGFTGAPATVGKPVVIGTSGGSYAEMRWNTVTGSTQLLLYDENNVLKINGTFGNVTVVSGTTYVFALSVDGDTGLAYFHVDGIPVGSLSAGGAFTFGVPSNDIIVSNQAAGGSGIIGDILDFSVYSVAKYTGVYVPSIDLPEARYLGGQVTLPDFNYTGIGDIQEYTDFQSTQTGLSRWVVNGEYWNGAAWVASDYSYAQANTPADVLANIDTITPENPTVIDAIFDDSDTLQSLEQLDINFTGQEYSRNNPGGNVNEVFWLDGLDSFLIELGVPLVGNDQVKFALKLGTSKKWFNSISGEWEASDGSYAQMNTAAEIQANIDSFNDLVEDGSTFQIFFRLHSDNGQSTPDLDLIDMLYNFFNNGTSPSKCIVYGEVYNNKGQAVEGATIEVDGEDYYYGSALICQRSSTVTDSDGKWEMELVETNTYSKTVNFVTRYTEVVNNKVKNRTKEDNGVEIPNQPTTSLASIA